MGRQKQESEALQDAKTDAAAQSGDESILESQPSHFSDSTEYRKGFEDGFNSIHREKSEERRRCSVDIFHSLVHGMRIQVDPTHIAQDIAERVGMIHDAVLKEMEERGIIPAPEPAEPAAE